MSQFKVGDTVLVYASPAAESFRGKVATVLGVDNTYGATIYSVIIEGDPGANKDGTRSWGEKAFRKLTKLEKAMQ